MIERITVFAVINLDGKVVGVCSSEAIAQGAAPAFNDWHGHGSATFEPRQAIRVGGEVFLLAKDFGPVVALDDFPAAQQAKLRIGAMSKLSPEEQRALLERR